LELFKAEKSEINQMGQWAEGIQDQSYTAKLLMGAIRKLADFIGKAKVY
jgi:hypothetical protein